MNRGHDAPDGGAACTHKPGIWEGLRQSVGKPTQLVGLIFAFLGVSQLGRIGEVTFVPELVVVAQFRELGPLVTAIIVAGRSGAGIASEIGTMSVSEEVDALRAMGLDPMRWLVWPRCLAIVAVVPLLTWIGNVLAIVGGLLATTGGGIGSAWNRNVHH